MSKKVTIIIPMYNSEKFIERTLNSIFDSNLSKQIYDVLVVDDGSNDNGLQIVKNMVKDHSNLFFITQKNGGASKARNIGIEQAKTDYIWFVDSDDVVSEDLSVIAQVLNSDAYTNIDVFDFVFEWCYKLGEQQGIGVTHPTVPHDVIISGKDAILHDYVPGSVCALLLRRDFLLAHNLRFKDGITQQDVEFTYRMMAMAKKVLFKNNIIYNYVIRKGSISHTLIGERLIKYQSDKVEIIRSFYELASSLERKDSKLSQKIKRHADGALFGCVYSLYKKRKTWRPLGVNKVVLAKLKEDNLYPMKIPVYSFNKSLATLFLNIEYFIC